MKIFSNYITRWNNKHFAWDTKIINGLLRWNMCRLSGVGMCWECSCVRMKLNCRLNWRKVNNLRNQWCCSINFGNRTIDHNTHTSCYLRFIEHTRSECLTIPDQSIRIISIHYRFLLFIFIVQKLSQNIQFNLESFLCDPLGNKNPISSIINLDIEIKTNNFRQRNSCLNHWLKHVL